MGPGAIDSQWKFWQSKPTDRDLQVPFRRNGSPQQIAATRSLFRLRYGLAAAVTLAWTSTSKWVCCGWSVSIFRT